MPLICSPVGLNFQAGLELASGSAGTLLFSQCNVVWRSFVWAEGSGCQSFDSSLWFSSDKCGSSISAKLLIYGADIVFFCLLVTILDPSQFIFYVKIFIKCFSFLCFISPSLY
jgi:hypothetical protein